MQLKNLLPAALLAGASAQSLTDVLAANNASLSTLTSLLTSMPELVEALSQAQNITILAPSNDALASFLNSTAGASAATDPGAVAALLTYHVLNGSYPASAFTNTSQFLPTLLSNATYSNVTGGQVVEARLRGETASIFTGLLSDSNVTTANVNFTGGVVHVIDKVLTVPQSASNTAVALGLTSLAGALTTADLVSTVDSLEDVTIFAPSNDAFGAIGSALPNLTTEALSGILTYHVVQGTVGYSSLLSNTTLPTVNGGNVTITVVNGTVFVNSAKVTIPDVLVAGGVVHVIDSVLNPANSTATPPTAGATTTAPVFPGASSASDTPFTSGVTGSTTVTSIPTRNPEATSSSTAGSPMQTAAMGLGALFGGAAVFMGNM
ncbi:hypothetical protein VTL71DRAFT_4441 [Oculimacula yallundae]|uniref:FAS1 domain-containing protein n=1 Tax=Oculimacula yallundae TaxID=86028 RepID=A0ABR4C344_9HELO